MIYQESYNFLVQLIKKMTRQKKKHKIIPRSYGLFFILLYFFLISEIKIIIPWLENIFFLIIKQLIMLMVDRCYLFGTWSIDSDFASVAFLIEYQISSSAWFAPGTVWWAMNPEPIVGGDTTIFRFVDMFT